MDEIKKLYDALSKRGYYTKSFDDFKVQFQDKAYQDKVYNVVSRDGLYTKSKDEFLLKYSVSPQKDTFKKKEDSGVVLETGGEVGTSEPPLRKEKVLDYLASLKTPPVVTGKAPIIPKEKAILPVQKPKKIDTSFGLTKEKIKVDISPKVEEISFDADPIGLAQRKASETKNLQEATDYLSAAEVFKQLSVPSGYQAYVRSASPLIDKNTATGSVILERGGRYGATTEGLRQIKAPDLSTANEEFIRQNIVPQIERAAVIYKVRANPSFEKELKAVNTSVDDPNLRNVLGSAKMGSIMEEFLNNPDVASFAREENLNLSIALQYARDKNFDLNKEWGISSVANKVSREFERSEKRGSAFAPFATESLKKDIDEVAKQKLNPEEYGIYQTYIKGNEEQYLDTPSFLGGVAEGGKGVFEGILNTIEKVTGFAPPKEDVIRNKWREEAMNVSANPEGLRNIVAESGKVAGLVGALFGTGGLIRGGLGIPAAGTGLPATTLTNIADATNVATAFLGDMIDEGVVKYPTEPVKAYTSAIFNTLVFMAMGKDIFPGAKVKSAFSKVQPEVEQVVKNLANGSISREAARQELNTIGKKAIDIAAAGVSQNAKVSAELTGLSVLNEGLDILMDMDEDKLRKYYPEGVHGDTFKTMFLSNALVSSIAGYGKVKRDNTIARESIYEAASNPKRYSRIIEDLVIKDPNITKEELLNNLSFAVETKRLLDQRGIPVESQKQYLVKALGERVAIAEKEKIADSTLRKEAEDKIKQAQAEKEAILTAPEEVAPELPATEEKTYRVEYFDPESRKMTHQMFATEAEGEAFKKTLTREQASQGVTSYFEKAPAKGVGEKVAVPEVPATEIEVKKADIERRRQDELDKLEKDKINNLEQANKEPDTIPIGQKISIRENAIKTANDLYDYGIKRINAKHDAELAALGVGEVAPEAAPEVPAAPVQELKEGQQIQFNLPANQGQKTGTKVTVPGYEDVDFVAVQDGFNYDIYELSSGLKVTPTTSFSVDDAISQTAVTLASKGVTSEKLLSKIYNSEKAIKRLKINESPAIEKFKEKRIAEEEKVPFIHTEEERQKLFEIAKEAKEKGLYGAESIIVKAANMKSGNKMNEERAISIVDIAEKKKRVSDAEEQQKPYPQEDIVKREGTEEDFKQQINNEYKSDKYDTIPQDIRKKGYDAHRKLIEIANKYGYYPKSIKELKADPVIALSIYLRATGAKKVETRTDRIKAAEKVVDDTVKSINEIYNREFPEKAVGEVVPEAAPEVPAAPAEEEVSDRKFWDEYGKSDYSYGQYGGKSSDTLYIRDRKSGKVVKEIKIKNEDFDGAKKEVFKWIDSKSGTKILEAYEEVYGEPELPVAPEKTQDEVAKEQTKETDLLLGGQAEQRRKDGKYTKDGVEYVRNPKGQGTASEVTGEVRFTNEVSLPFKYKLVEAETLQPSHQDGIRNPLHFIPEAQPKNRNDIGSLQAEESFANNPRFSELGENTNAYSGAPVVNERGEVVQGNNRSAGLRKGYQRNNPQYKNDLAANAEQFGFTREQVEGMKNPVLVREVAVSDQGAIELGNYDAKDLETGGKRRIDPVAVTRRMPFDVKGRIADLFTGEETLNQAIRSNQKRLLELLNPYLNQAQRNTITREGVLTDAGIKDLEAVVQQFLFDNGDTALPDLFENLSATQKEGLRKSLPYIYSAGIEKSIIPEIQEAILAANEYKESGAGDFNAWLAQGDIFNEGKTPRDKYTELELAIARTLVESKTQKEISKKFIEYADKVKDKEADMFEPAKPGQSKEQGVQETFNVKYNAKPISERGGKEVAPKEKPAAEPSAEKRPKEAKREPELPETDKRAEARKKLKDALDDFLNAGIVYDPRSQAEKQVRLTKAIINAIREEAIGAIKDLKKYLKENIGIDISDNDAKYLLIESKKPEYAIQEPAAGEVPVQPEARVGGEVAAGVPPTEPPKVTPEGEAPREERKRTILNRIIDSPNTPESLKEEIRKKGLSYEPAKQAEATRLANAIIDAVGIDKAVEMADRGEFADVFGGMNTAVLTESATRLTNDPVKQAQVFDILDRASLWKGQDISYLQEFYTKNPLGVVIYQNAQRKESFREWSAQKDKSWQEALDVLKAEVEQLKKELTELRARPEAEGVKTAKAKAAAARQKRAFLIEKYKKNRGGGLTLSAGGLTKEGIEFVGEVAATYIQEGIANVEVLVQKVLADIKDVMGRDIPDLRDQVEAITRESFQKRKGQSVIDRIRKKLDGLSNKEKEEVIRKSYKKILDSGGLDFQDFKDIIADVLGRGPLTEEQANKLKELTKTINNFEVKSLEAQEKRTPQALGEYRKAQYDAANAARELSFLFNSKPNIMGRLTSIMQLNTLGIPSLINNPVYNVINQAFLRFPIGLVNTLIDRSISGVATLTGKKFNPETNVFSRQTQIEFFRKLNLGLRESGGQLLTGLNRQDYIQKEVYGQQIRPLDSMKNLYRYLGGNQKMGFAEVVDNALQATVGVPAEAVARVLNLGDKPQRFGAEGALASEISKALGIKGGIDYELFIEFPKAEAYRIYKSQGFSEAEALQKAEIIEKSIVQEGKRSTFQQDNFLNDKLSQLFSDQKSGVGAFVKSLTISPYIKIPSNAFWSYYNLLHPEIALLQAFAYGGKAAKFKSTDPVVSKMALREARYWFAHATVGLAYVSIISSMVAAGVFTPGSTAEDTKKEREGRQYYGKPGTTNVTKLMAWLRGEDATKIEGGYAIQNKWFGHIGSLGNAIARREQEMTQEQLKNRDNLLDFLFSNLGQEALEGLQSGVFSNTSSLINALQSDFGAKRYGLNVIGMLTNVVHPAALSQISRNELPYYSATKADSFMEELRNSFLQRSSFIRQQLGQQPPAKVGIWGDKLEKKDNFMMRWFGISKENPDNFAQPLYDIVKRTNNISYFPPTIKPEIEDQGKKTDLNIKQTMELEMLVGQYRKNLVAPLLNDMVEIGDYGVWSEIEDNLKSQGLTAEEARVKADDIKLDAIKKAYENGFEFGKQAFLDEHPEFRNEDYDKSEIQRRKKAMEKLNKELKKQF